ncbi:MAG: M20/M25/M40 family metallo-hydrolase [Patulibacter sp.]|nr:M20/M25/M40 family metallo-hydrolase [Patulibacter sp.]
MINRFAIHGLTARRDATGNVIAILPGTAEPPVMFAAHLDTVFPADTDVRVREVGEHLHAPGIGDNSLGVAAVLHLARALAGRPLARSVALVATVGEEGLGDLRGAKALVGELPMHAFVAVEGMGIEEITVGGVGSIRIRAELRGPGGHPWSDQGRPSAIHGLVTALAGAAAVVESADEPGLVFNVGTVEGGTAVNVIAATAVATLELRCEDDAVLREAAARVGDAIRSALPPGLELDLQRVGDRPGGHIDADHPLVLAARRARAVAGLPPANEASSSTDANAAHGRRIPAITVGITTGAGAHTLGESIDTAPVGAGLRALAELAEDLAVRGAAD